MKFTRINENAIRCVISHEEMDAQGIDLEELMGNRAKAEEFLRYVLQQARYEINFVTTGDALNVQLSVTQNGDVSMMISDDQNLAVRAMLMAFKEKLKEFQDAIENSGKVSRSQIQDALTREIQKSTQEILSQAEDSDPLEMEVWAEIADFESCVRLANVLSYLGDIPSSLYRLGDVYYLQMELVQTKRQMAHNVFAIAEYSQNMYADGVGAGHIMEQGKCIMKEHALVNLAKLA